MKIENVTTVRQVRLYSQLLIPYVSGSYLPVSPVRYPGGGRFRNRGLAYLCHKYEQRAAKRASERVVRNATAG